MKAIKYILALMLIACLAAGCALSEGHYGFNPYVTSSVMNEIFGEARVKAYLSMVDAVLEGRDSFECPDQETYDWIIVQYPYRCFPLIAEYVHEPYRSAGWKNGRGYIEYSITKEEFAEKLSEFENTVTGILNSVLGDDMSDFEKALALYLYFADNYTYDYDTFDRMQTEYVGELSACRFLERGTGVCQEAGTAYSYLLLQAGVDATIAMGVSDFDALDHLWSYVTIDGVNYHIDATFVMGNSGNLSWFMMTDEKRYVEGTFPKSGFVMSSSYAQCHDVPEYTADDDRYWELWGQFCESVDWENNVIRMDDGTEFKYEK